MTGVRRPSSCTTQHATASSVECEQARLRQHHPEHSANETQLHFEIDLPPLPEQRKIARILSTVDDLIERTEALIAKYRAIKQGLMHDLLTRGVDASGRLRPPREEAPGLYRESAVGWVPREWEVVPIRSLVCRITYGFTNPMPTTAEGPWMITALDIADGRIQYATARHTSQDSFDQLTAKSRPQAGDILVTKDGTLGRLAVVDREDICINQSVASLPSSARHEYSLRCPLPQFGRRAI